MTRSWLRGPRSRNATEGYRFAAPSLLDLLIDGVSPCDTSPYDYQSGGRHHHNHIINKKVGDTAKGYHHNHSFSKKVGDNHFKILAYRKAAKVLEDYPVDVEVAYQKDGNFLPYLICKEKINGTILLMFS
jgi:hypothetical protein